MNSDGRVIDSVLSGDVDLDGDLSLTGELSVGTDLEVLGNALIEGDLEVKGAIVADLQIDDPLWATAINNNLTDNLNLGYYSHYGPGPKYAGLIRNKDDKKFYLGNEIVTLPTSTGSITNSSGNLKMNNLECVDISQSGIINNTNILSLRHNNNTVLLADGTSTFIKKAGSSTDRVAIQATQTILTSDSDVYRVYIQDDKVQLTEGATERVSVIAGKTELFSPDKLSNVDINNTDIVIKQNNNNVFKSDGTITNIHRSGNVTAGVSIDTLGTNINSPDTLNALRVRNTSMAMVNGITTRFSVDSTETKMISPNGSNSLSVNNTESKFTGDMKGDDVEFKSVKVGAVTPWTIALGGDGDDLDILDSFGNQYWSFKSPGGYFHQYGAQGTIGCELRSSNGTIAVPTASTINNPVCNFSFSGHNGTEYKLTSSIESLCTKNWSVGDTPSKILMRITPDGETIRQPFFELNGTYLKIGNQTTNVHYTLPTTRGSNNQILKTDASGVVTWQNDLGNFDQTLNTTDNVTFNNLTLNGINNYPTTVSIKHNNNNVLVADGNATNIYRSGVGNAFLVTNVLGTDIFSPDGLAFIRVRNNLANFVLGVNSRLFIDATNSQLLSPDNTKKITVSNTETKVEGDFKTLNNVVMETPPTVNTGANTYLLPSTRPLINQVLTAQDGNGNLYWSTPVSVFGTNYHQSESDGLTTTTSSTFIVKTSITTSSLPLGNYRLNWSASLENNSGSGGEFTVDDGVTQYTIHGIDSSTPLFNAHGGFKYLPSISGVKTFNLKYRALAGTSGIKHARLDFYRVS